MARLVVKNTHTTKQNKAKQFFFKCYNLGSCAQNHQYDVSLGEIVNTTGRFYMIA